MEFGRVLQSEIDEIDFTLPKEPLFNKKLYKPKRAKRPQVYLGCAKWGRPEWVGKLYPPKTKEKNFLDHYVKFYNSIELNATHYKIYGPLAIRKWSEKAGEKNFKFCPKMYQGVTHRGKLKGKQFITGEFLRGVKAFENHLGPIFLMVNETFGPKRKDELFTYLESLPKDMQFFLEVRHKDWFRKREVRDELFKKLRELGIGAVITDTSGRRDCAHMHLTIPKAFIRFVGNSLHPTDYSRCDAWVERIKYWLDHGIQEIYFFMHMHDEATSPELTVYLAEQFNAVCGLDLKKPEFVAATPIVP